MLTEAEKDNYVAYLLADSNGISIKVAKYSGTDKVDLIENEEYGYCSLIKATKSVLDKLEIENRTFTKITSKERVEKKLIDPIALREAVINAFVHNDYTRDVPPVFEIFSDRIQITSYGGLPMGLSEEDFFNCRSMSRNRELMRVFKDIGLVEQLGSGMSRILKVYDRSIFEISENFMVVTFKFSEKSAIKIGDKKSAIKIGDKYEKHKAEIIEFLTRKNTASSSEIAEVIGLKSSRTRDYLGKMVVDGLIVAEGEKKNRLYRLASSCKDS